MNKIFCIGNFCFRLIYDNTITPPKNFMLFEAKEGNVEFTYTIFTNKVFPDIKGKIIIQREDLIVFQTENGESRLIGIKGSDNYYAYYEELDNMHANVYVNPNEIENLNIDPVFTSLLALEKKLANKDQMILHCAYIKYNNEAILFSAPSETGKTTQANLWKKYLNSETINGDRALLGYHNNQWIAQGWPVCGSSEICNNENTPIKAIIMLSQAKDNSIELLNPAKAFSLIYTQITINKWNRHDHLKIMDNIEKLINEVPIYHLSCNISKEAVYTLKDALEE